MRGRHNIVGTEVGRPRPPFYSSSLSRLQVTKPRSTRRWVVFSLLAAGLLGLIVAARLT
jgi:hypothetical protein